jgi:hypothetical protein
VASVISATITGQVASRPSLAAPVTFRYNPADPYAVVIDLTALTHVAETASGEPLGRDSVVWTVGRYLFVEGLHDGPTGDGDVRVSRDGPWLLVRLCVDGHAFTVRFASTAVDRFLRQTRREVRLGGESKRMAVVVDDTIARLLGGVR